MSCQRGMPTPEDCAVQCWSPALDGAREGKGWRADCPAPECGNPRTLEYTVRGRSIWWNSFCPSHPKDALRTVLDERGVCVAGRKGPAAIRSEDLAELALSGMPRQALCVRLLEMSGMALGDAMDKLGIERANRYRLRRQLCQRGHKTAGR